MSSPTPKLAESFCPLCSQPNHCGQAEGSNHCWCHSTVIPQNLVEYANKLRPDQKCCICASCIARLDDQLDAQLDK